MIFGDISTSEAADTILAHTVRTDKTVFKKGRILSLEDTEELIAAGRKQILVAQLEENDVHEDEAAAVLAKSLTGENIKLSPPFTGRCNLYAETHGVLIADSESMMAANLIDESLTIATLPQYRAVSPDELIGTAKIIPFSVPKATLKQIEELSATKKPILQVKAFQPYTIGLIVSRLPNTKKSLLDKAAKAMKTRLKKLGNRVSMQIRCSHDQESVAEAVKGMVDNHCDIILVIGPSATVDRRDVVPSGFCLAGGIIDLFGIPVDPGNLLLLGQLRESKLVGVPGCARSLALNGFDFILQRLLAGLEISREDIAQLGLGGLLKETPNRPQPRE
ncbi:MAG: molybdopterin-binding protein [Rhodospirillales bacterium]|nr:molybdopterin-binding protein [Rhodospirillales bacterium]